MLSPLKHESLLPTVSLSPAMTPLSITMDTTLLLGPSRRVQPDKIASVAARVLPEGTTEVRVALGSYVPRSGDLVAVRVLSDNPSYDRMELGTGRPARLGIGDILIGALAARRALKGYVGDVPSEVAVGDELALLNMGGTVGRCTGFNHGLGEPVRLEYLGAVLSRGSPLAVANVADAALPAAVPGMSCPPVIAVAGSCMHAGKTRVATELVRRFTAAGWRVAAGKTSGIACMKDTLEMRDHGAVKTLSFVDLGYASTVGVEDLAGVAHSLIAHLADGADVIVLELGDGLLGGYNVGSVLDDPVVRRCLKALAFCAGDFVSAWGGVELLGRRGLTPDVISGAVTDSRMGVDFIRKELGVPAANAVASGATLFALIQSKLLAAAQGNQE